MTLRAYHEDEAPILVSTWGDAPWFAPKGTSPRELAERVRERIRRSGTFTDGVVIFAIESGGRLMGEVQARQPIEQPTARDSLRRHVARRSGLLLLKGAQALLRYGDSSRYLADTRPQAS